MANWKDVLIGCVFLGTGAINTLVQKTMYQTYVVNMGGECVLFDRAWLLTLVMFFAEFFCMIIYGVLSLCAHTCCYVPLEDVPEPDPASLKYVPVTRKQLMSNPMGGLGWRYPCYTALFSLCDLLATTMGSIGMIFCDASIIRLISGFTIVFVMLLAWPILKRKPNSHQVLGVFFAFCGLVLVGVSAIETSESDTSINNSTKNTIIGLLVTLAGQVFQSIQMVLEEKLLKQDDEKLNPIPPLFLVGSEGFFGTLWSVCVALPVTTAIPGSDFGSYENQYNSWYELGHSATVGGLAFVFFLSITVFNWSGFLIVKALNATARNIISALATVIVWVILIITFYATRNSPVPYGEGVSLWSILEVAGFVFMVMGTITHNNISNVGTKLIGLCTGAKDNEEEEEDNEAKSLDSEDKEDEMDSEDKKVDEEKKSEEKDSGSNVPSDSEEVESQGEEIKAVSDI